MEQEDSEEEKIVMPEPKRIGLVVEGAGVVAKELWDGQGDWRMASEETIRLANMIYGEVGSLDEETMAKVGSTMFNRMNAGREKEFGVEQMDVLRKGYNAVKDSNDPYTWATTGKFPNKDEEARYKKALQVAYGLESGSIPIQEGMFFFTPKEEARMRKQGKKVFDFSQVRKVSSDKNYNYYSY